jgi:hypothetical protein
VWVWLKAHTDHLIAGVITSLPVSVSVNIIMHHLGWILATCHVPAFIIRWTGN